MLSLKTKIQQLIDKCNIYNAIFKNQPLDLIVPNGVRVICENLTYAPITTTSVKGTDVEEITQGLFQGCNISTVDLPKLKTINQEVFSNCSYLFNFSLPNVETVGESAFYGSELKEFDCPKVAILGDNVFYNCENLERIVLGTLTEAGQNSFKVVNRGQSRYLKVVEVGVGTSADLYLQCSRLYSQAVLHKIVENLADKTGQESGVLYIGTTNIAKIDEEHIQMLNAKNWSYL